MREILLYFALKYAGDFKKIYDALEHHEKVDESQKKRLFGAVDSSYVTIIDGDYPESLKKIDCPPFVLFYHGNLAWLKGDLIAIIGMRQPSDYGIRAGKEFTSAIVALNWTTVSGMARGIDTIVHETTLEIQGKTVAVLGSGINLPYPRSNQKLYQKLIQEHLVISEYPNLTAPIAANFPRRNRIIAGLAAKILVVEAKMRSGTMITVGYGLDQGKDIYAVPGRYDDYPGTNHLIFQGAGMVLKGRDILE